MIIHKCCYCSVALQSKVGEEVMISGFSHEISKGHVYVLYCGNILLSYFDLDVKGGMFFVKNIPLPAIIPFLLSSCNIAEIIIQQFHSPEAGSEIPFNFKCHS